MKIGIIGTGMLGEAVGLHLLDIGYEMIVFNRSKEKTENLIGPAPRQNFPKSFGKRGALDFFNNRNQMKISSFALTFRDLSPQIGSSGMLLREISPLQNDAQNLRNSS